MRILVLSDRRRGGAAIAAKRLAAALHERGGDVRMAFGRPPSPTAEGSSRVFRPGPLTKVVHLAHAWSGADGLRGTLAWSWKNDLRALLARLQPNVINLHNLHGIPGWGPSFVAVCARHAPVAWTLHDMWSFTGRCTYSYDCRKFLTGCDHTCPTPNEYPALSPRKISGEWTRRRNLLTGHNGLIGVAPSRWLAGEAGRGLWAPDRIAVIPNGVPLDVYAPVDRSSARSELGVDNEGPVVLATAQTLSQRRKGMDLLLSSLPHVRSRPLTLITMGQEGLAPEVEGVAVRNLGYVDRESAKVLAYNAADLMVHPARVDNLPNTVVEALACGTPVVGFPIGGMLDLVRSRATGWLAERVGAQPLAAALDHAIDAVTAGRDLRATCREVAEEDYDVQLQARRYAELFRTMMRGESSRTEVAEAE